MEASASFYAPLYASYNTVAIVPLRLSDDDVKALDALVNSRLYRNRSEAARALIRQGARVRMGEARNLTEMVGRLLEARKKGRRPFTIAYKSQTAIEMVAEGRGR